MAPGAEIIEADSLVMEFPSTRALDGLQLSVPSGIADRPVPPRSPPAVPPARPFVGAR